MSSDPVIAVENVSKVYRIYERPHHRLLQMATLGRARRFREFKALDHIDLTVGRGETVGIIGRNGCGKSTLLQIICGTLQPTTGDVATRGRISALLELGAGFNTQFTGRENVLMNGAILGISEEEMESRFADIVEFAAIGDFIDQPVRTYSSGMFVRLAFATAVSVEPDILVVDEALAVGDEAFQRKCMARIEQIQENGGTILFVSHSVQSVVQLCNRAVLIDAGEKLMEGSPKEVTARYQRLVNATGDQVRKVRDDIRAGHGGHEAETADSAPADAPDAALGERSAYDPGLQSQSVVVYEERGARIGNIRILDDKGRVVNLLRSGAACTLAYEVHFLDDCEDVGFGSLIKTVEGFPLGGANSALLDRSSKARFRKGETVSVRLSFRCCLNEGHYFLNVGVQNTAHGDTYFMHRVVDALMFRVDAGQETIMTAYVDFDFKASIGAARGV